MERTSRVLVGYATAAGSTQSIAERISDVLRSAGATVVCRPVGPDLDPGTFDAVVLGSAVHSMAWLTPASDFLGRVPASATNRLWCFSVGGLPHPERAGLSRWLAVRELQKIEQRFPGGRRPREHRMFAGIVDLTGLPLWGRLFFRATGGASGDQRDWPAIEAWAADIASQLEDSARPEQPGRMHRPSAG
ncbi:MAG: flavodoxin domain-containing protein [Blastococcus sp.]